MGATCLRQRQLFAHDGSQVAVLKAGEESGMNLPLFGLGDPPQGKGVNGCAASHQVTRRDRNIAATADHDNTAMLGK